RVSRREDDDRVVALGEMIEKRERQHPRPVLVIVAVFGGRPEEDLGVAFLDAEFMSRPVLDVDRGERYVFFQPGKGDQAVWSNPPAEEGFGADDLRMQDVRTCEAIDRETGVLIVGDDERRNPEAARRDRRRSRCRE